MELSIISPCLVKGKVFSDNSNLKNLVDVQHFHEDGKLIICVSDGVYTLFNSVSPVPYCFIETFHLKVSQIFYGATIPVAPIHLIWKKLLYFPVIHYLPKEKCSNKKNLITRKIMLT